MGKKNKRNKIQVINDHDSDSNSDSDSDTGLDNNLKDISVYNLSVRVPGKTLIKDSVFKLSHGHRYGLIGINGSGKSTLLRQIATNEIKIPKNIDKYYVEQEVEASDKDTLYETVIKANTKRSTLLKEQRTLENKLESGDNSVLKKHQKICDELEAIGASKDESIVKKILYGLGFFDADYDKPTKSFSGGWRMRISLAKALYLKPTLLLLDEPTNHLDLNATIWLKSYLIDEWKGTLLVVSHDRDFLDEISTDMIHLFEQKLDYYRGNYTSYLVMFEQKVKHRDKEWNRVMKRKKEMHRKSKPKKEVDEMLKKENVMPRIEPYEVKVYIDKVMELSIPVLEVKNVDFGYHEDKLIYKDLSFGLDQNSRITIVGANGIGKSTLLKLIAKEINPSNGQDHVFHNHRLRLGFYHQHTIDYLPSDKTPIEFILSLDSELSEQDVRKYLGRIKLEGDAHKRNISCLSGGQKSRVALVAIFLSKPHIILFDEPTNHLDIETVDALIDGITSYNGGVVMVTHDIDLIRRTNCVLWEVTREGKIQETTYDDYSNKILDEMTSDK